MLSMRIRRALLLSSFVLFACSHGFDGPTPVIKGVSPSVICNAQIDTTVTITGTGFTPVPEHVLTKMSMLVLPSVTLTDATGKVFPINQGDVLWTDQTTMSFVVHGSTMPGALPPGVYDVTVTDPTGKSGTLKAALTIVPPPDITSIMPNPVSNGMNTTITIKGDNFRMTPTVSIAQAGMTSIALGSVTFVDAQTITAVVAAGTPAGTYTLTLTNPDGCSATAMLTIINPVSITVTGIVNPFGCNTEDTPVTISGTMFVSTPQAALVGAATGPSDLKLKNVAFVSSTKLTGAVPQGGVIGGPYPLKVTNPDGTSGTLPNAFTITKLCPPVIDDVEPNSVVHSYATPPPIVITGANFRSDAKVYLVDAAGVETLFPGESLVITPTQITMSFNAAAMNLTDGVFLVRVKEADASVPSGGTGVLEFGDFSLFVVTNPSGKFLGATTDAMHPLPSGRRGLGVIGGQNNAAARYLYAIGGDGGGTAATSLASGLFAQLDVFGHIGDLGWQPLRKTSSASPPADTANDLPSARTGVAIATFNNWIYLVGGTTALATGAAPAANAPIKEVLRAHILSAIDAPTVTTATSTGGTLAAGTYYYKVSMLISPTSGYGTHNAETVASDEQVVTISAAEGPQLSVARPATSSVPAGNILGYRIYRSPMANGVSQSEVWLADVMTTATSSTFTDDGSKTPGTAHPLAAGMLSEWEPAVIGTATSLLIARAYPAVTLALPPGGTQPNLYALGGASSSTVIEKTWEFAGINADGSLSAFGPTGLDTTGCAATGETCMTAVRSALYASTVTGPPNVTTDVRLVAGAGSPTAGAAVQEEVQVLGTGLLGSWASVPVSGPSADFTAGFANVLGPVGFYENGNIGLIGGFTGGGIFSHDEFTGELCSVALVGGSCPANNTFTQQSPKSNSGLNPTLLAWTGYTITSGYIFMIGGSTDGINAVATVQQGAQ
jgi:hypothetical protein